MSRATLFGKPVFSRIWGGEKERFSNKVFFFFLVCLEGRLTFQLNVKQILQTTKFKAFQVANVSPAKNARIFLNHSNGTITHWV